MIGDYFSLGAGIILLFALGFYIYAISRRNKKLEQMGLTNEDDHNRSSDIIHYIVAVLVLVVGFLLAYFFYFKK